MPGRRPETRAALLAAASQLIAAGARPPSAGAIAARAGLSRLTVYHHFGSLPALLAAVAAEAARSPEAPAEGSSVERLRHHVAITCTHWATNPALYRHLESAHTTPDPAAHELAAALAAEDRLRPGCSLREAEDVIAIVTSFAAFERLHQAGRRPTAAVAEILMRMVGSILVS